ncbi:MAG: DUF599 domain-containing protein [Nitratireductor sp.]
MDALSFILDILEPLDILALSFFVGFWLLYEIIIDHSSLRHKSLSGMMAHKRREWMLVFAERELRMFDEGLNSSLQRGTGFFASVSIFAIGGCFALLNATDVVLGIFKDLNVVESNLRAAWELKIMGLTVIFVYSFFKFAWAYRLFNYCAILMGSVPMPGKAEKEYIKKQSLLIAKMNMTASKHFTAGTRGIFFACAYIGWLVGPLTMMFATVFVMLVLIRRQFFSNARKALDEAQA